MPTETVPAAVPPPSTGPTIAPTPSAVYNPAKNASSPSNTVNILPGIREALERRAGQAPERPEAAAQPQRQTPGQQQPAPAPAKGADKVAEPPQSQQPFVPPDEQPPKPETPPAQPANAPAAQDVGKQAPAQLREAYERVKTERDTILAERDLTRKEAQEYRTKLNTLEERIKALEPVEGRAKELEQKVISMDEQLRVSNYLQHPEFHEKYVKPVADAMQSAISLVKDLIVEGDDGTPRIGTEQDFHEVLSQPNTTLAQRKAKELFGDLAATVVEARQKVRAAQELQTKAVKNASIESQKWIESQSVREAQERTRARSEFQRKSEELANRYPDLYKAPEGDKEALAARKSGEELASIILEGNVNGEAPDQYLEKVAKVFHRAASSPMRELTIARQRQEIQTLKEKLAAYEKSTPDTDSIKGVDAGGMAVTPEGGDMKALMRESLTRRVNARR